MATSEQPYFTTQGGGIAVMNEGQLVWETPPSWLDVSPGDPVPLEWAYAGPFDRQTNELVR